MLMNEKRAKWAEEVIWYFEKMTGTDREDALADLLCDLMHWADRQDGIHWVTELDRAEGMYLQEITTFKDDACLPQRTGILEEYHGN